MLWGVVAAVAYRHSRARPEHAQSPRPDSSASPSRRAALRPSPMHPHPAQLLPRKKTAVSNPCASRARRFKAGKIAPRHLPPRWAAQTAGRRLVSRIAPHAHRPPGRRPCVHTRHNHWPHAPPSRNPARPACDASPERDRAATHPARSATQGRERSSPRKRDTPSAASPAPMRRRAAPSGDPAQAELSCCHAPVPRLSDWS